MSGRIWGNNDEGKNPAAASEKNRATLSVFTVPGCQYSDFQGKAARDTLRDVQGTSCRIRLATATADRLAVERVEAYLRTHLDTPVTVGILCGMAGMSERRLRDAFRRICGTSPKRYVLAERPQAVRRVLSEGSLRAMTVTEVATSHGFYELGRFSVSYRSMYGEAPSETLRASRR